MLKYLVTALFAFALMLAIPVAQQAHAQTASSKPPVQPTGQSLDYVLGPDDQITLWVPDADDWSTKPVRIDGSGTIRLPLIGTVKAGGLSVRQLSAEIERLLDRYLKNPEVVINVTEYRSQPVSVFGAVNTPGILQLQGHRTLIEMLAMAGGLKEDASNIAKITRPKQSGPIPLPGAQMDPSGEFSTAEVDLALLTRGKNPESNLEIRPHDVISVPRADTVFVMGEVEKAGGYIVTNHRTPTAMSALALAGGLKPTASPKSARILRSRPGAADRDEMAVNLSRILDGKEKDVMLQPDDILYIPGNASRKVGIRAAEAAVQTLTGVVIWRSGR